MDEPKTDPPKGARPPKEAEEARLASALRANLRRRKAARPNPEDGASS